MTGKVTPPDSNCAGLYHWPPIWLGSGEEMIKSAFAIDPNTEVLAYTMGCGIEARASLKGVFVFDFSNWPHGALISIQEWEKPVIARMRFMNLFLACFYSLLFQRAKKIMEKMFIDYSSYAFARKLDLDPTRLGCDWRQAALIQENEKNHQVVSPWHPIVTPELISDAIKTADSALVNGAKDAAILGELLLHAFASHDNGKYEASHISAWTIVERCLNELWRSHLDEAERKHPMSAGDEDKKFINSKRLQKLTGRDFTASIISEMLSLSDVLPYEQFRIMDEVRQIRNGWLHKLNSIGREESGKAINLARFMLKHSQVLEVDIPFNVISSVPIASVGP